jgi:hypothetical protein
LFVEQKMNGASGQWRRAASSRVSVPLAFSAKSTCGSVAAPVVGRLRRCVHDEADATRFPGEVAVDRLAVADVDGLEQELVREPGDQRVRDGGGRRRRSEEARAHVVLEPDDRPAARREVNDRLGSDEPAPSR